MGNKKGEWNLTMVANAFITQISWKCNPSHLQVSYDEWWNNEISFLVQLRCAFVEKRLLSLTAWENNSHFLICNVLYAVNVYTRFLFFNVYLTHNPQKCIRLILHLNSGDFLHSCLRILSKSWKLLGCSYSQLTT